MENLVSNAQVLAKKDQTSIKGGKDDKAQTSADIIIIDGSTL